MKSPTKKDVSANLNSSSSRIELSSFFDASDVRGAEYDPLFPRKNESIAVQTFKKSMLETVIKPKSWKDHQNHIDKSERLLNLRHIELEISEIESKERTKQEQKYMLDVVA